MTVKVVDIIENGVLKGYTPILTQKGVKPKMFLAEGQIVLFSSEAQAKNYGVAQKVNIQPKASTDKGFRTHNESNVNSGGTSLQGYVSVSYHELLSKFGEPTVGDAYKIDAEWEILFDDGKVATIYNWKDGKNYNGSSGMSVEDITEWHIGGRDKEVVSRVQELLGK